MVPRSTFMWDVRIPIGNGRVGAISALLANGYETLGAVRANSWPNLTLFFNF